MFVIVERISVVLSGGCAGDMSILRVNLLRVMFYLLKCGRGCLIIL